jgi:hypothetical protein
MSNTPDFKVDVGRTGEDWLEGMTSSERAKSTYFAQVMPAGAHAFGSTPGSALLALGAKMVVGEDIA